MPFPNNLKELLEFLNPSQNEEINKVLVGIVNSWQQPCPGKDEESFFLLRKDYRRAVVKDFLSPEVKVAKTRLEWGKYLRVNSSASTSTFTLVPYWYQIIPLSEIAKNKCGKCQSLQPVIEYRFPINNEARGRDCKEKYFVLCLDCQHKTNLNHDLPFVKLKKQPRPPVWGF